MKYIFYIFFTSVSYLFCLASIAATVSPVNVGSLLVTGELNSQTMQVMFDDYATDFKSNEPKNYYIAAALPDGSIYFFTQQNGWIQSFDANWIPIGAFNMPVTILSNNDMRSFIGATIYTAVSAGTEAKFNIAGIVRKDRIIKPVGFPFKSGEWSVIQSRDLITDNVFCGISANPITDDNLYKVSFGWSSTSKDDIVGINSYLWSARNGDYLFSAHPGYTVMRVDTNPFFSLNTNTGSGIYLASLTPPIKIVGPRSLYFNYGINVLQMTEGTTLVIRFTSKALTTTYDVSVPLKGFGEAVNAFDYCVQTQ